MHFPTWVDLKGEDSVPETVHHVVVPVNPKSDRLWERLGKNRIRVSKRQLLISLLIIYQLYKSNILKVFSSPNVQTDEVHAKDNTRAGANSAGKTDKSLGWTKQ